MDRTELLLAEMTDAYGPPGHEEAIAKIFKKHLEKLAKISYDKMGSIIAERKGTAAASEDHGRRSSRRNRFHGLGNHANGFIKMLPLGGWWGHVALGQRVVVLSKKGPVIGVIGSTPPHILEPEARKKVLEVTDMYVDVGVRGKFDVKKKLGIQVGDVIVPDSKFTIMATKDMYLAKAIDNRYGCAAAIEVMWRLEKVKHPNTLYSVGSVQEEVGLSRRRHGGLDDQSRYLYRARHRHCRGHAGNQRRTAGEIRQWRRNTASMTAA